MPPYSAAEASAGHGKANRVNTSVHGKLSIPFELKQLDENVLNSINHLIKMNDEGGKNAEGGGRPTGEVNSLGYPNLLRLQTISAINNKTRLESDQISAPLFRVWWRPPTLAYHRQPIQYISFFIATSQGNNNKPDTGYVIVTNCMLYGIEHIGNARLSSNT